jgi:hypothetical protein
VPFVSGESPQISPSGTDSASPTTATTSTSTPTTTTPTTAPARLTKISAGPVVPGIAVVSKTATSGSSAVTTVSHIERQSGNVYSYNVATGARTRTSNKTIPRIQSAVWLPDASTAFVRYLSGDDFSTINTYALHSDGSNGFFLPQNLSDVAVSPSGVLTLSSGVNGSILSLYRTDGTKAVQILTTPLSFLRISFAGKGQYIAFTKPSASISGAVFLIDSAGHTSRVAGNLNGLVALASPSGKWVLVSSSNKRIMQMSLVNTTTGELISLPVATIADKCVWTSDDSAVYCGIPVNPSSNFNYPDDWYQGTAHFSDRIWKIDVAGRYAQLVLDFSKDNEDSLDADALAVDELGTVIAFTNKNDGSLWSYQL